MFACCTDFFYTEQTRAPEIKFVCSSCQGPPCIHRAAPPPTLVCRVRKTQHTTGLWCLPRFKVIKNAVKRPTAQLSAHLNWASQTLHWNCKEWMHSVPRYGQQTSLQLFMLWRYCFAFFDYTRSLHNSTSAAAPLCRRLIFKARTLHKLLKIKNSSLFFFLISVTLRLHCLVSSVLLTVCDNSQCVLEMTGKKKSWE